jgi:hypothetical protein
VAALGKYSDLGRAWNDIKVDRRALHAVGESERLSPVLSVLFGALAGIEHGRNPSRDLLDRHMIRIDESFVAVTLLSELESDTNCMAPLKTALTLALLYD